MQPAEREAGAPHDGEVDQQRQRDPGDVERLRGDRVALEREQDDDREQQAVERQRPDPRQEALARTSRGRGARPDAAGQEAGGERDAEEDQHGAGDLPDPDLEPLRVEAEPAGQHGQVEPAEQREGDDLEDRVEGDQHRGALAVAAGEVVPDRAPSRCSGPGRR